MKIMMRDGREFQGTPKQIVQQMQTIAMPAQHLSLSEYIEWVAANALKFEAVELRCEGETDDEKAATLVAEMIRNELCVDMWPRLRARGALDGTSRRRRSDALRGFPRPRLSSVSVGSRMGPEATTSTGRVLIVEDDEDLANLIQCVLRRSGSQVRAAHDAKRALEVAAELDPHVVLLDLHLHDCGGHELGVQLRAASGRALQIIAFTGDVSPCAQSRSEAYGFAAHIVKPARLRDLVRLIAMLGTRASAHAGDVSHAD